MSGSKTRLLFIAAAVTIATPCICVADFDKATKAYLLGQYEKARYEALIAASDGHPAAQMLLGQLYFNGEGVEKDLDHAMFWYNRAADNGFSDAQYRLGILYHDGSPEIEKNLDLAFIYLSQALESGHKDAIKKLEWLHKTELGIVVNLNDDIEVLKKVAASGNQKARFLLSQKLIKGAGVPQDKAAGVKMLQEDAALGFIKAQKQLGELYYYGDGVEKDFIQAYGWSMAYAGTKKLGGIAREGKQIARSALRQLPQEVHNDAYLKSKEYFENFVLPFHANAREVGPEKYRIVVRSRVKKTSPEKQETKQQTGQKTASSSKPVKPEQAAKSLDPVKTPAVAPSTKVSVPSVLTTAKAKADSPEKALANQTGQVKKEPDSVTAVKPQVTDSTITPASKMSKPTPAMAESPETASAAESEDANKLTSQSKPLTETVKKTDAETVPKLGPVASREDVEIIPAEPLPNSTLAEGADSKPAPLPQRKFEDVYNVLVRKKSALNRIYAKEYELNKQLQGRIVFEIMVTADGKIGAIEVLENTVDSPTLEQSLIDYLKNNVTFTKQEVAEFKISYPVDFLPP